MDFGMDSEDLSFLCEFAMRLGTTFTDWINWNLNKEHIIECDSHLDHTIPILGQKNGKNGDVCDVGKTRWFISILLIHFVSSIQSIMSKSLQS